MEAEGRKKLTFTLALTVRDQPGDVGEDVLVRGTADQTVGELARHLAAYLGRPSHDGNGQTLTYGLRVDRTGEQLRPSSVIGSVDLLEGDTLTLLTPRVVERRRPRWAEPDEPADAASPPKIVPLRPRQA
jgi:hypothetical protein